MTASNHAHHHPASQAMSEAERVRLREPAGWDERYAATDGLWSGAPNEQLVTEAADLTPGTALDMGCGEGGDAIWLASRGWRVTAADFSQVGLDRGRQAAQAAGVGERIDWLRADARTWAPGGRTWDLVTSHFLHLTSESMLRLVGALGAAVSPGGTLLVVGHHPLDNASSLRRPHHDEMLAAEDLASALDAAQWDIAARTRAREVTGPDGEPARAHDSVLVAVRH